MSKNTPVVPEEVVLSKAPVTPLDVEGDDAPAHHRAALREIRDRLADKSLEPGKHVVYIAPSLLAYDFNGETRQFSPLLSKPRNGSRKVVGGIVVTSDPELIARLDHYAVNYSGDVQRVQ